MNWSQLEDLFLRFGGWLIQPERTMPAVPQHVDWGLPTPAEEDWADDWCRKFFMHLRLVAPSERHRYVLVPRFRFAALHAHMSGRLSRDEFVSDPKAKWEELLVTMWHQQFRAMWLTEVRLPGDDASSLIA